MTVIILEAGIEAQKIHPHVFFRKFLFIVIVIEIEMDIYAINDSRQRVSGRVRQNKTSQPIY